MNEAITMQSSTINIQKAKSVFDLMDVSEATREDYKSRIQLFASFIGDKGFNRDSFLEFKRYLSNRIDYSISSKNKYLATARIFLKELHRQGVIPFDITQNTKSFTQSKKHKKDGLNESEVKALSEVLKNFPNTAEHSRLKAIFSLLALQGLRQIEITRLDVEDIDIVRGTAFIQGKGRDDKEIIYLQPSTLQAIKEYLKANNVKSGALFVSNSNCAKNQRLTTRGLRKMTKNVLNELRINKTIHGFRHYFTTTLIKTYKGDLLEVSKYTRHRSLEMLQVYNDNISIQEDLPRFFGAFKGVDFNS